MDQTTNIHVNSDGCHDSSASAVRRALRESLCRIIIALVWLYRITLGPVLGGQCIYQPTCSQYMIDAVRKHGPIRGAWRGIKRISRCHPWGKGGYDPA